MGTKGLVKQLENLIFIWKKNRIKFPSRTPAKFISWETLE